MSTDLTRQAMQFFCEPYFHAIDRWMKYDDVDLFKNRIKLIATAVKILSEEMHEQSTYDVVVENPSAELLPIVVPTAGSVYVTGGDQIAFNEVKKLVSTNVFHNGGLYFQNFLLKALAGGSANLIASQNVKSRMSAIRAVEIVFRLSKSAGMASFTLKADGDESEPKEYPLVELSNESETLFETLKSLSPELNPNFSTPKPPDAFFYGDNKEQEMSALASKSKGKDKSKESDNKKKLFETPKKAAKETPASKKKKVIRVEESEDEGDEEDANDEEEEEEEEEQGGDEEPIEWTTNHPKIGARVAAHFDVDDVDDSGSASKKGGKRRKVKKVFCGTVKKYAPESAPGENDELFHIQWDDGDEEDYDVNDLKRGEELFNSNKPEATSTTPKSP